MRCTLLLHQIKQAQTAHKNLCDFICYKILVPGATSVTPGSYAGFFEIPIELEN